MDTMYLGLFFDEDGGMSIQLNLTRDSEEVELEDGSRYESVGLSATISLLHDSTLTIGKDDFNAYYNYLTTDPELITYYQSCYDTRDLIWRGNFALDITVGADLLKYVLNWSSLFANELDAEGNKIGAAFYIQALENMKGDVTLRIQADVNLLQMDKWALNILVQALKLDEAGNITDEYFSLYIIGSLNTDPNVYEAEGIRIYLTIDSLKNEGLNGILLSGEFFSKFLRVNLTETLNKLGEDLQYDTIDKLILDTAASMNMLPPMEVKARHQNTSEDSPEGPNNSAISSSLLGGLGISEINFITRNGTIGYDRNGIMVSGPYNEEGDDPYTPSEEEERPELLTLAGSLLESIMVRKGFISIVVARTVLGTLLNELMDYPFSESLGEVALDLDTTENFIRLRFGIDYQPTVDLTNMEMSDLVSSVGKSLNEDIVIQSVWTKEIASGGIGTVGALKGPLMMQGAQVFIDGVWLPLVPSAGFYADKVIAIAEGISNEEVFYLQFSLEDHFSSYGSMNAAEKEAAANILKEQVASYIQNRVKTESGTQVDLFYSITLGEDYKSYESTILNERVGIQKYAKGDTYVVIMAMSFTTQGSKINMDAVTPSRLGNFRMNRTSAEIALEEISAYETRFLTEIELKAIEGVSPKNGVVRPVIKEAFVRFDEQDQTKEFARENSGHTSVFFLVYDPLATFDYNPGSQPYSEASLAMQKAIANGLVTQLSDYFRRKLGYEWRETKPLPGEPQGSHELVNRETRLTITIRAVKDALTGEYKVIMAVSSTKSKYNLFLKLSNLDIGIGEKNLIRESAYYGKMNAYLVDLFLQSEGDDVYVDGEWIKVLPEQYPVGSFNETEYETYFENNFKPLSDFKWDFEVNLELSLDDNVIGFYDFTQLLTTVIDVATNGDPQGIAKTLSEINFALQPNEEISIVLGIHLRVFIDFSDLVPLKLQLEITYNDKSMLKATYFGGYMVNDSGERVENSVIYADLSGLGFPAIKLEGVNLGEMVLNLLGGVIDNLLHPESEIEEEGAGGEGPGNASAEASYTDGPRNGEGMLGDISSVMSDAVQRVRLSEYGWDARLLLLTICSEEVTLAITGALAVSLLGGIGMLTGAEGTPTSSIVIPNFRNLSIGYSKDDNQAGIILRLTDDSPYEQAMRIGVNFRPGYSIFTSDIGYETKITPDVFDYETGTQIEYEDAGILSEVGFGLEIEARIRTRANEQKSPQIIALERLVENLAGMTPGAMTFDTQNTILVFSISLAVYANLADFSKTTLSLSISLGDDLLIGVYFLGDENSVYADLKGLGLFQVALRSIDVVGILNTFLGEFVGDEGIDLGSMITGMLSGSNEEETTEGGMGPSNAPADPSNAPAEIDVNGSQVVTAGPRNASAGELVISTDAPLFRIMLTNEELILNPNMAILTALAGSGLGELPKLADLRLGINIKQGINNLALSVKLDRQGNALSITVPERGLKLFVGSRAQTLKVNRLPGKDRYGGIVGLGLGVTEDGELGQPSLNLGAIIGSIVDSIDLDDLTIYIDKRNDYFYLRNMAYGGSGIINMSPFELTGNYSTGPTYYGKADGRDFSRYYDASYASVGGASSLVIGTWDLGQQLADWGVLKPYTPVYLDNAFRRLKLRLNKTSTNLLEVGIDQLTQVAGVDKSDDPADWVPQSVRAFMRDYTLHVSLSSILVLDISGAINWILSRIISALMNAIWPGTGGGLVGSAINAIITPLISDWLAGVIGDATGYGNPLRVGAIIDDLVGKGAGGIPLTYLYIPDLLAETGAIDLNPNMYGTLYGVISGGTVANEGVEGVTVQLWLNNTLIYETKTDKDGKYAFINVQTGDITPDGGYAVRQYEVRLVAPPGNMYNSYPQPHEPRVYVTVGMFMEHPATELNLTLSPYGEHNYGKITVYGTIQEETDTGWIPSAGASIYFAHPTSGSTPTLITTTDANGYYTWTSNEDITGYSHAIRIVTVSGKTHTGYINLNVGQISYYFPHNFAKPTTPPIPDRGSITITLDAMEDQPLFTEETATEIKDRYVSNNGEPYPEAALEALHPSLGNGYSELGDYARNGGAGQLVGVKEISGLTALTYQYADYTNMNAALRQIKAFFELGGDTIYDVTEIKQLNHYHAVSYSRQVIIEVKTFASLNQMLIGIKRGENVPVQDTDVEIWLERDGRTIRESDYYDGHQDYRDILKYFVNGVDSYGQVINDGEEGYWAPLIAHYYNNTPRDYTARAMAKNGNTFHRDKIYKVDKVAEDIMANGVLTINNLALDKAYIVKVRSPKYMPYNFDPVTMTTSTPNVSIDTKTLAHRPEHWSSKPAITADMIQGLRIRLGADMLDAASEGMSTPPQSVTNPGYTQDGIPLTYAQWSTKVGENVLNSAIGWAAGQGVAAAASAIGNLVGGIGGTILENIIKLGGNAAVGQIPDVDFTSGTVDAKGKPIFMPWTNYIQGYKKGPYDSNDAISYLELWISPSLLTGLFGMINNILNGLIGYGSISPDTRYAPRDIFAIPDMSDLNATKKEKKITMLNFKGLFDESRDEEVYNYVFDTAVDYIKTAYEAPPRYAGGAVSFALDLVFNQVISPGTGQDILTSDFMSDVINFVFGIDMIDDVLDQVTRLVSHLLPLTEPYSMIDEKDLENSPLQSTEVLSTKDELAGQAHPQCPDQDAINAIQKSTDVKTLLSVQGILDNGVDLVGKYKKNGTIHYRLPDGQRQSTEPKVGDDGELIQGYYREHEFNDRSVYGKVCLNNNFGNLLERIILFINGASYLHSRNVMDLSKVSEDQKYKFGYGMITDDNRFFTKATILRADTVMYDDNGDIVEEDVATFNMIQKWISKNVVNSYVQVHDYKYVEDENGVVRRYKIGTTFIRDVYGHFDEEDHMNGLEKGWMYVPEDGDTSEYYEFRNRTPDEQAALQLFSAKDDRYLELDIHNTGLKMRAINSFGSEYFSPLRPQPEGQNSMTRVRLTPPTKLIFHDPYNILDFTAIGGSWAGETGHGGFRSNLKEDGTYTVTSLDQVLPERNLGTFVNGDSSESAGIMMFWDLSSLDMTKVDGTRGYIKGYMGNLAFGWNETLKQVTKIEAEVKPGMVIDPNSTLWIKKAVTPAEQAVAMFGYVQDTSRTEKVIDLPEINPLTFDEAEYRKILPTKLDYAVRYRQTDAMEGTLRIFTDPSNNNTEDFIYKRYVFDDLTWDFSDTNISYEGGIAYIKLTYSNTPATPLNENTLLKGAKAPKITINVPVRVKNVVATKIDKLTSKVYTNLLYENGGNMTLALSIDSYSDYFAGILDRNGFNYGKEITGYGSYPTALVNSFGAIPQYQGLSGQLSKAYYNHEMGIAYLVYTDVTKEDYLAYALGMGRNGYTMTNTFSEDTIGADQISSKYSGVNGGRDISVSDDFIITFNPFDEVNVPAVIRALKGSKIQIQSFENGLPIEGVFETINRWAIDSIDSSAFDNFDPETIRHDDYTIWVNLKDIKGHIQSIAITVKVLPRTIVNTNIDELLPAESRIITPFNNSGFGLPNAIHVDYGYNADEIVQSATLIEGVDFVWVHPSARLRKYNYTGTSATSWQYVVKAKVGEEPYEQYIDVPFTINQRIPQSVKSIDVYPYSSFLDGLDLRYTNCLKITQQQNVVFSNGITNLDPTLTKVYFGFTDRTFADGEGTTSYNFITVDEETAITYNGRRFYKEISFKDPSFEGKFYYIDVLVSDPIFGEVLVRNVRVTMRKATLESLNIAPKLVSPYYAETRDVEYILGNKADMDETLFGDIDALLAQKDILDDDGTPISRPITANVYKLNIPIPKSAFDIVDWRFLDSEAGMPNTGSDVKIIVRVANRGFDPNYDGVGPNPNIWIQEIPFTLTQAGHYVADRRVTDINNVEVLSEYKISKGLDGIYEMSIADPMNFEMPTTLAVTTADGSFVESVPVRFDLGPEKNDFYKKPFGILGTVTTGSKPNNKQTFQMRFINEKARDVQVIKYYVDDSYAEDKEFTQSIFQGFDGISLPKFAEITVKIDGDVVEERHNVRWVSVEGYSVPTAEELQASSEIIIKAVAWIGDDVYGYIPHDNFFTVQLERIVNYTKDPKISINPYLDTREQLKEGLGFTENAITGQLEFLVETNLRSENLTVKYNDVNFDYRGATDVSFPLYIGTTVDFGGVESIVDKEGNPIHSVINGQKVIEVRQVIPQLLDVKERIAAGIKTWYGNSDLTGSIYEPLDFYGTTSTMMLTKYAYEKIDASRPENANAQKNIRSHVLPINEGTFAALYGASTQLDSTQWPEELVSWDTRLADIGLPGIISEVRCYTKYLPDIVEGDENLRVSAKFYFVTYKGDINLADNTYLSSVRGAGYGLNNIPLTTGANVWTKHIGAIKVVSDYVAVAVNIVQGESGVNSIGTCSVVAISKRGVYDKILTTDINSFDAVIAGATRLDSTLWPVETIEWDALISTTRLQGSIVAVYYNESTSTYYVFYRGDINLYDPNYLTQISEAGYTYEFEGENLVHVQKALTDGHVLVVDIAQFEEGITVTFESGAEEKHHVDWRNVNIRYTYLGGRYVVQAVLYEGHETLEQVFNVTVNVLPAVLESLEIATPLPEDSSVVVEDGKIVSLLVDPYEGFKSLPERAIAVFEGGYKLEIDIVWDYAKILEVMTTSGGEFNRENNMAALASIYRTGVGGKKLAIQSVEIPVTVIDRALQGIYVSEEYYGSNFTPYSPAMTINPYARAYSELFDSPDFAYFRRVVLLVQKTESENFTNNLVNDAYKEIVYTLDQSSYRIRDTKTGLPTNTTDLYTGRLIDATVKFGATSPSAAKDAKYVRSVLTTILDMTYVSGGMQIAYFIDPYGIRAGEDVDAAGFTGLGLKYTVDVDVFADVDDPNVMKKAIPNQTIETVSGVSFNTTVTYDRKDLYKIYENGRARDIDARGGVTKLYAEFGNDYGGYQTKVISVRFEDRSIDSLFNKEDSTYASVKNKEGEDAPLHFVFDPFENYQEAKANIYPRTGINITFTQMVSGAPLKGEYTDGVTQTDRDVIVSWDDANIRLNYKGVDRNNFVYANIKYNRAISEQTADKTAYDAYFAQRKPYLVRIMDRTVTGFTDLFKPVLDGLGNRLFEKDEFGNLILDDRGQPIPVRPKIRPYDYSMTEDVSEAIVNDVFRTNEQFVLRFDNMVAGDASQYDISFTLGGTASNFTQAGGVTLEVGEAEADMPIRFILDSARGLSYKGRDARFYMKIPGFGLGKAGEQIVPFDVPCQESYIIDIRMNKAGIEAFLEDPEAYYDNATLDYYNWLREIELLAINEGGFAKVTGISHRDTFYISNPYYFISRGGVPIPDKMRVHVGPMGSHIGDEGTYYVDVETSWTNMKANRARIAYNKEVVSSTFQMDLDNQPYSVYYQIDTSWVLEDDIILAENTRYGREEVILMPGNSQRAFKYVNGIPTYPLVINPGALVEETSGVYSNDQYKVTFANSKLYTFDGISGGGSYSNNYNKWSFDDVSWNAPINSRQYATMTLGGRGGQIVKWGFFVDGKKKLVNNSVPNLVSVQVGQQRTLPAWYRQLFAGTNLTNNKKIPVEYSDTLSYFDDPNRDLGFIRDGTGRIITGSVITPHKGMPPRQDDAKIPAQAYGYAGYVEWNATSVRAYPAPSEPIGGRIVITVFASPEASTEYAGAQNNLVKYPSYMHNPDAMYGYNIIKEPLPQTWIYPSTLSTDGFEENYDNATNIAPATNFYSKYNTALSKHKLNNVPRIVVGTDSMFDLRYLPTMSLRTFVPNHTESGFSFDGFWKTTVHPGYEWDYIYPIPWQDADVYWTANRNDPSQWNHNTGYYGQKITGGFAAINTGATAAGSSRAGGRYTLVVDVPFASNYSFGTITVRYAVALDITNLGQP